MYCSDFWKDGVGLASEFGCAEGGTTCGSGGFQNYPAGATNGVLGYEEAGVGGAFLKIGVGKLRRTSWGDYSPFDTYSFAEFPKWSIEQPSEDTIEMTQEVSLNYKWGYRLKKTIRVTDDAVHIDEQLTNIGSSAFRTVQYYHNFFSVNWKRIGSPLCVKLVPDLNSVQEPAVGSWARPLRDYFVSPAAGELCATREVDASIKAVFVGSHNRGSTASWSTRFQNGQSLLTSTTKVAQPPLYAYNLYVEGTTLSPEPFQMLDLPPGASAAWTRTERVSS